MMGTCDDHHAYCEHSFVISLCGDIAESNLEKCMCTKQRLGGGVGKLCNSRRFGDWCVPAHRTYRCHAGHREIQRCDIHCFFRWSVDDFRRICIVHPHIRVWTLRYIR